MAFGLCRLPVLCAVRALFVQALQALPRKVVCVFTPCLASPLLLNWRAAIAPLCSCVSIVLFGNTMDFISSLHHARESKRRVVCVASQRPSFSGSSVDALFQARAARASAKRDTLPFTVVAVDSAAQVRRSTAVPVVAETPCSDYIMDCVAAVLLVPLGFACNHPRLRFVSHGSQRFMHRHATLCVQAVCLLRPCLKY